MFLQLSRNTGLLTVANTLLKYCGVIIVTSTVLMESYCKRPIQRNFWKIYHQIEINFKRSNHNVVLRNYLIKFGLSSILAMSFYTTYHLMALPMHDWVKLFPCIAYVSLMLLQDMRVFHYLFFVRLLDYRLADIEQEMQSLADDSENQKAPRDRLKRLRVHYDLVYEMSNCINDMFGWSNFVNILYLFSWLAASLNMLYSDSRNTMDADMIIFRMFCLDFIIHIFKNPEMLEHI